MRELIETLKSLQRKREQVMKEYKRQVNQGRSAIRFFLGWNPDMKGTKEGDRIIKEAGEIYKAIEKDGVHPELVDEDGRDLVTLVLSHQVAYRLFHKQSSSLHYRLGKNARKLPKVGDWADRNHGIGLPTLGMIVGECGSLSKVEADGYQGYKTVSRVVKRMQLAVIDGKPQGKPGEVVNKKRVASKEEWLKHGSCPRRKAVMWNVANSLVNAGERCPYRPMYEEKKAMYLARGLPLWHAHLNAKRRIAKRLLADMWEVWNDHDTSQRVAA